jgi:anti-sigma factor ChrR (cupin superfamily)
MPDMPPAQQLGAQRRIFRADDDCFVPYAPYGGEAIEGLSWINIDFDEHNRVGTYLLKFAPGAGSVMHEHGETEQFLIMDGELIDCDGYVMKPGDFLRYDKGSQHSSRTVDGCTILVVLKGANKKLGPNGAPC